MFSETEYQDADFEEAEAQDETLSGLRFFRCRFAAAKFSGTCLRSCRFENCDFSGTELNGLVAEHCAFLNCRFRFASCFAAEFRDCKMTGSVFDEVNTTAMQIVSGDWSLTYLSQMDFRKQTLSGVNFSEADLSGCIFDKAILRNCVFTGANLNQASFRQADLRGSRFNQVNLLQLDLHQAKIDLEQAILIAESLGAVYTP